MLSPDASRKKLRELEQYEEKMSRQKKQSVFKSLSEASFDVSACRTARYGDRTKRTDAPRTDENSRVRLIYVTQFPIVSTLSSIITGVLAPRRTCQSDDVIGLRGAAMCSPYLVSVIVSRSVSTKKGTDLEFCKGVPVSPNPISGGWKLTRKARIRFRNYVIFRQNHVFASFHPKMKRYVNITSLSEL